MINLLFGSGIELIKTGNASSVQFINMEDLAFYKNSFISRIVLYHWSYTCAPDRSDMLRLGDSCDYK
jgi:hypothetical protein